ncbi:hypothetical protein U0D62_18370 [Aquimarina sp. 2201CG5-10]|nr:hypothetical protein [Aquimarina sp. 2201CG5-10]
MQNHFVTEYTASLEVIPVKEKVMQEKDNSGTTLDLFTHILRNASMPLDLFGVSSKMSQDTYPGLSPMFLTAYDQWVTTLKRDCLLRQRLVRHMKEKGSSYSHWMTPQTVGSNGDGRKLRMKTGNRDPEKIGNWRGDLKDQVKNWATPVAAMDGLYQDHHPENRNSMSLATIVMNYPTPQASETEKAAKNTKQESLSRMAINGQLDKGNHSFNGRSQERLNPAWVAQLMGTTLEQNFFANMVTE